MSRFKGRLYRQSRDGISGHDFARQAPRLPQPRHHLMAPRSAPGHSVKLPVSLYARAVMAAELHGRTVGQWVEMAVHAQLERDRHTYKVARFDAAKQEATQKRQPSPLAQDYGLPPTIR